MSGAAVRAEYKETEVGVIPETWEVKPLFQVAEIRGGIAKNSNSNTSDPLFVHYLRVANVQDGYLDLSQMSEIQISRQDLNHYTVLPGDVLMNEGGDLDQLGRGAIWRGEFNPCVHQNHVFVVRCRATLLPDYLNIWTGGCPARRYFLLAGKQTTNLASISKFSLGQLPVALPPLPEQHAIAAVLGDVDALISGLDQLIAKKRDLKQAVMQQLLTGQRRLPGFSGKSEFKTDQFGTRPNDWEMVQLRDLVDPSRDIRYGIVQPGKFDPSGRYMIRGQDYSESKGWANPIDVFRVSASIEDRYRNARVREGDLIMTIVGYCGHVQMVPAWLDGANLTQTTARIAIQKERAVPAFCKYMLQSPVGKLQVAAFLKGAAQPGLNCGDVEKFVLPLPSIPEQSAIATVLSDMDTELAALESRREKTRDLKQGMMQELLTGRIRLV